MAWYESERKGRGQERMRFAGKVLLPHATDLMLKSSPLMGVTLAGNRCEMLPVRHRSTTGDRVEPKSLPGDRKVGALSFGDGVTAGSWG